MNNKIQIIRRWQKGGFISHQSLRVALTYLFNLKCIFYNRTVTNSFSNFELADETWKKIIGEADGLGIPLIDIA